MIDLNNKAGIYLTLGAIVLQKYFLKLIFFTKQAILI